MNKKAIGTTIQEVASSIAHDVFPGKQALAGEIGERIASYANAGTHWKVFRDSLGDASSGINKDIQDILFTRFDKDFLSDIGLKSDAIQNITELSGSATQSNLANTFDAIKKAANDENFSRYVDDVVGPQIAKTAKGLSAENVMPSIGKTNYALNVPRAYFDSPDKKVKTSRIAAAAAAYAGVSVGGRVLSGGTLTRDQYGRKDIAGIPFI